MPRTPACRVRPLRRAPYHRPQILLSLRINQEEESRLLNLRSDQVVMQVAFSGGWCAVAILALFLVMLSFSGTIRASCNESSVSFRKIASKEHRCVDHELIP